VEQLEIVEKAEEINGEIGSLSRIKMETMAVKRMLQKRRKKERTKSRIR